MTEVLIDAAELRKLRAIEQLARHLDVVISEFGPEPAYVAEAAQALHDKLNGGPGYLQLCNVCYGVPVPGTGRCISHTEASQA